MKALLLTSVSTATLLMAGACQSPGSVDLQPTFLKPGLAQARAIEASGPVWQEDDGADDDSGGADDHKKSPQQRLDDAIEEKVLSDQERSYKEAEVEIARLEREAEEIEINETLREKRAALAAARKELALFEEHENPLEERKARLALEKAREQLLKAETDLINMRKIMDEEAEAEAKDEIVRRYEKAFEFAQENLAIETDEMAIELRMKAPAQRLELSGAVRAAEAELLSEEVRATKKRMESELAATRAKHDLDKAKRDQKKAKEAVAKARRELQGAGNDAAPTGVKGGDGDMEEGDGK